MSLAHSSLKSSTRSHVVLIKKSLKNKKRNKRMNSRRATKLYNTCNFKIELARRLVKTHVDEATQLVEESLEKLKVNRRNFR